jgi:hypothetical protein
VVHWLPIRGLRILLLGWRRRRVVLLRCRLVRIHEADCRVCDSAETRSMSSRRQRLQAIAVAGDGKMVAQDSPCHNNKSCTTSSTLACLKRKFVRKNTKPALRLIQQSGDLLQARLASSLREYVLLRMDFRILAQDPILSKTTLIFLSHADYVLASASQKLADIVSE